MADNCHIPEGWSFYAAFPDGCWPSDAISHETDSLTRALHLSLSPDTDVLAALATTVASGYPPFALGSASDADNPAPSRTRNPAPVPRSRKISKRKFSRASRRSTTTFIVAEPANFRQMVEQVTGARRAGPCPVAAPEPRPWGLGLVLDCPPTLGTSALGLSGRCPDSHADATLRGAGRDAELPLPCFPTLELWGVM